MVEYGWLPLVLVDKNGSPSNELKPKQDWNRLDNEGSEANAKTLYYMYFQWG